MHDPIKLKVKNQLDQSVKISHDVKKVGAQLTETDLASLSFGLPPRLADVHAAPISLLDKKLSFVANLFCARFRLTRFWTLCFGKVQLPPTLADFFR